MQTCIGNVASYLISSHTRQQLKTEGEEEAWQASLDRVETFSQEFMESGNVTLGLQSAADLKAANDCRRGKRLPPSHLTPGWRSLPFPPSPYIIDALLFMRTAKLLKAWF